MYKKGTKLIAGILVFIMMSTYLSIVGEVIAVSLESQSIQTNHSNVEFDSYFKKEDSKTHTMAQTIGEENYLYAALTVKEIGYLKEANITIENANFSICDGMESEQAYKVNNKQIALNPITAGEVQEIAIPIQMLEKSRLAIEEFNKENTVKLTGIYVDGNGKERNIEKEIKLGLAWTASTEAELNMQIAKFIPYNINEQKGLVLQTIVKSYLQNNTLPVKENKIEISVPTINNIKPKEVRVTANSTKATNGDETGSNFKEENYVYNEQTNKLEITVSNEANEQGIITWQKKVEDEFLVTYIYDEEALNTLTEEGTKIVIEANSVLTTYGATESKVSKEFIGEVTLKDQISNLVDFSIKTNVETLSKGQIYANAQTSQKVETEYKEKVTATIGLAELTDQIIMERKPDNFLLEENKKIATANADYYKSIEIDKEAFQKILGEEGIVNLYTGATLISTINKETEANEEGKMVVDLAQLDTNQITIETSKPQEEGELDFILTKAIKGEINYTNEQMKKVKGLELNLTGKAINMGEGFVDDEAQVAIPITEPTSQAELSISNNKLSTIVTNKDVKITAILKTDTQDCMLYKDPILEITLPSYVQNVNLKDIEVLFDTQASKLTLNTQNIRQNEDGSKTIVIGLSGTQTEYTLGAISKGLNIVITADITLDRFTPNKQDQITMKYTNHNIETTTQEINIPINIVAPVGIITTTTVSNYAEGAEAVTAINGEEKVVTLPILKEARNAEFVMTLINNYNNTIDEVSILGRTAFVGNRNMETQESLGSTMNMPLTSNITVNGIETSKVEIYYSENGEATKDLTREVNGWTLTPTNLEKVKSYLIVLKDHTMNIGDRINFSYTAQIPENLQHNESAFEQYAVYFNNNLETGTTQDKQMATKVGLTTGRGPVIEASLASQTPETEQVLSGNVIKYNIRVKNTGTETAQNVTASIELPQSMQYVEFEEGEYKLKQAQGQLQVGLGNVEAGKTVEKEIALRVGVLSSLEDTKEVEMKAMIRASNIAGELETQTVRNQIARTHFILSANIQTEKEVLKENDSYTYYMEVLSSGISEIRENTVLTIVFPEEIEYEGIEIKDKEEGKETDITNTTNTSYDSKTRTLTINLGNVEGMKRKVIYLKVKVGTLQAGVYDKMVNIEATVSATDARNQRMDVKAVNVGKVAFKITQTCNIPHNSHISAGEDFTYTFTIENLSNMDLYNVKFTDMLPEGVKLGRITVTSASGTTRNSYEKDITFNILAKETVTVQVYVNAEMLDQAKSISNKASIEYEGVNPTYSSNIDHIIDQYDETDFNDPDNPNNPNGQTKRIMGTVWMDANLNGARDEGEDLVSDVPMLLFNNQTGNLVTNGNGSVLRATTDQNGSYTFSGLRPGKYTVIFLYDSANFSATSYRRSGVDSNINSDAVDSNITLDGVSIRAAITEEIAITDSNIYNIDLGLVSNPKFDLALDKTVSKITVQDSSGTNVFEFNDTKLAKKDLVGKNINNSTIIVEYKLKVSNQGAIAGYVKKIADYIPSELKFNSELNKDWYSSDNGILFNSSLANTLIAPGESKEVTLILTKKMSENNLGLYHNEAEIYEAYNDLGVADIDSTPANKVASEDDLSSADVLISVKTGEAILFVGLSLSIILTIGLGAYFIKKKVLR